MWEVVLIIILITFGLSDSGTDAYWGAKSDLSNHNWIKYNLLDSSNIRIKAIQI